MPKLPVFARSAAIVALLILAAAATYFWWRQLPGRMEDGCNLHERRCSAAVPGGGRVTLGIEPRPLAYSQPWHLTVALDEAAAEKVEIDFTGLDVPTTFNRIALAPSGPGKFAGEATLPM